MLTRLTISNYALIQELSVEFSSGLNMVTGETGAGKSIILGALGLILGNRADLSSLKNKEEKCIVEGNFEVGNYNLKSFFDENDLDYDPVTILRREITPAGKSRAFINDTPVTLKTLEELSLKLIDIHSQHQNLELGNQKFQLDLVDSVSNSYEVLTEYKKQYSALLKLKKKLEELVQKSEKANADLDYFQFQFSQLDEAKLLDGEQEELETELEKLTHAEEIKTAFQEVLDLLDNEQFSVVQNLKESQRVLEKIRSYVAEAPELNQRLQSVFFELKDIQEETELLAEKIEHDPAKIELVNDRLNLIYSLQQKHHVATVQELIDLKNDFDEKINQAVGYGEEILAVEKELKNSLKQIEKQAALLTETRKKAFPEIENKVVEVLQQLGMGKARLKVSHENLPDFGSNGKDSVALLFSANSDAQPAEISKIASGGEMSRLMLAIKNLLRNSKSLPTVIFDEIDTGVSGEVAVKMGNILKSFSSSTQIINITHLPQIAAKGDTHFMVYKYEENGKTFTSIRSLNKDERIQELAKMVGGEEITTTTLKTAKELLNK